MMRSQETNSQRESETIVDTGYQLSGGGGCNGLHRYRFNRVRQGHNYYMLLGISIYLLIIRATL